MSNFNECKEKKSIFDKRNITILGASLGLILVLIFIINFNVTGNTTKGITGNAITGKAHFLISDNPPIELRQVILILVIIIIIAAIIAFIRKKNNKKTEKAIKHKRK